MSAFLYPVTQPIKQWPDLNGAPLNAGYIYFGTASQNPETNPIQMYWDAAGTIPAAQPIRTTNGFIVRPGPGGTPANVYATGDFSITVRNAAGVLVFTSPTSVDLDLALSIAGASSAAAIPIADAGGYYIAPKNVESVIQQIGAPGFVTLANLAAAVTAALVPTGASFPYCGTTAPTGYVLSDGNTIGNVASGATERANADTSALYTLLWNAYTNTELPIQDSTGTPTTRGASASNDFTANKRLPLPDTRGRVMAGKDNMGGSTASRLTNAGSGIDGTVMGKAGGAQTHTLTTAEMPSHTHTVTDPGHVHGVTDPGHLHTYTVVSGLQAAQGGAGVTHWSSSTTANTSSNTTGLTVNSNTNGITLVSTGGGTAHSVTQPTIIFTVIIKL